MRAEEAAIAYAAMHNLREAKEDSRTFPKKLRPHKVAMTKTVFDMLDTVRATLNPHATPLKTLFGLDIVLIDSTDDEDPPKDPAKRKLLASGRPFLLVFDDGVVAVAGHPESTWELPERSI